MAENNASSENNCENDVSQNLETNDYGEHEISTEDQSVYETHMNHDDTDELAELFEYFNYLIFSLENDINLPTILRFSNQRHQYENVCILYTANGGESIYDTIPDPPYENIDVCEFRRTRNDSGDYESIYENVRKKTFLQKIKDFFSYTKENLIYKTPLAKILFSNGDVFYKYTEAGNANLEQNDPMYISKELEESIYENINNVDIPINSNFGPLPPPPLPNRNFFPPETEEPIYEEIGFTNHTESLYAFQGLELPICPPHNRPCRRSDPEYVPGYSDITYDAIRWPEEKQRRSVKEILRFIWTLVCTGIYIIDVGSDIYLALRYWFSGYNLYCGLTISLVYIASTVDLIYSVYRKEYVGRKIKLIIMFILNVRGVFEYINLLQLQYKNMQTSFVNKVMQRNLQLQRARIATLMSYEGIFEACPQVVLQLYLIFMELDKDFNTFVFQTVSVISSLCASGAAFVNMEQGVRLEDYGINDLSIVGVIVQYLWLSPITASRLLSMALLLCVEPLWLWLGAVLHLTLGAVLYWRSNEAPATLRKAVNACIYGTRVFVTPYEPAYVRCVVPTINAVHALQNAAATATWATAVAPRIPATQVAAVCSTNFAVHAFGLVFAVLFHKCKRRFYTFHNVTFVEYGYAVVQIV